MSNATLRDRGAAEGSRYVTLDAMRGAAALAVATYHLETKLLPGGYLAVDFFFLLSGFVLTQTYAGRMTAGLGFTRFGAMRAIRLLPVHVIGVMIGAGLALVAALRHWDGATPVPKIAVSFAFNVFMVPDPFEEMLFPVNGPAWTLLAEMLASFAFAGILVQMSSRGLMLVCVASLGALAAFGWSSETLTGTEHPFLAGGFSWATADIGLLRTIFSFPLGVLIARLLGDRQRRPSAWAVVLVGTLLVPLALPMSGPARFWFDLSCIALVFPALLMFGSSIELPRLFVPLATVAGEVSYPLYAVHIGFEAVVWYALGRRLELPFIAILLAYLSIVLTLAFVIARYIDPPIRRALTRRFLLG